MDKTLIPVLIGGLIGFTSSLLATVVGHVLAGRRLRAQLERENQLRNEEREREDLLRSEERERENQLRNEERAREDQLRSEERKRENQLRSEEMQRQSLQREIDMLARDMERARGLLDALPQDAQFDRNVLESRIEEMFKRRRTLQNVERDLTKVPNWGDISRPQP